MPSASSLVSAPGPLARLLTDPRIKIAELDPRQLPLDAGLFPEETRVIASSVQSRREQFSAGRWLARRAWQELGQPAVALLNDEQRVPIWPAGIVGTITHTQIWCAVAVARSSDVAGLGADVEAATALEVGLWERVCRPEERAFLEQQPAPLAGLLAKATFSAKESIYKALYPTIRSFLDFQAMRIELQPLDTAGNWTWWAELQVPWGQLAPGRRMGPGKLSIDNDLIVTAIVL
jgi:4'-phosphopantetheinyl transferase EntD